MKKSHLLLAVLLLAGAGIGATADAAPAKAKQELRDRSGKLLGTLRENSPGHWEGRLANGKLVGTYDEKSDTTRKANGTMYGRGNLLSALVLHDQK